MKQKETDTNRKHQCDSVAENKSGDTSRKNDNTTM
jgi:hypothetical protein